MNNDTNSTDHNPNPEEGIRSVADNVKMKASHKLETCEAKVRESPTKAVLLAAGTGYCLNRLPVLAIFAIPLRLTALLAKPALLVLGGVKLYEVVEKQSKR